MRNKNKNDHKHGNHLAIFLLLVPIVVIYISTRQAGLIFPMQEHTIQFLLTSILSSVFAFSLMFVAAHYQLPFTKGKVVVSIVFALLWSFAGMAFFGYANMHYDRSMPMKFSSTVKEKKRYVGSANRRHLARSHSSYYLRVNPWRNQPEDRWVDVSRRAFEEIPQASLVEVSIKEGFLGWEWIESVEPVHSFAELAVE